MTVQFEKLSPGAKVWLFKSSKPIEESESSSFKNHVGQFLDQWLSHGDQVKGAFSFEHQQFLIIGAETNGGAPSGCSTDTLFHFISNLSKEFEVDFMDNAGIYFRNNEEINRIDFRDLKKSIAEGKLNEATLVLNSQLNTKVDFDSKFFAPALSILGPRPFESAKG